MTTKKEMDRVCGMWVEVEGARITSAYKGGIYYFCSEGCKGKFDADPERFMPSIEGRTP